VTAPPEPKLSATALPMTVLSGDELRIKATSTLGTTLQNEAGINNQSFGPGVGTPVIRGQSGPRVRILQDSIGSLDVSTISPDHASTVEPLLAETIEVVRGPGTLLYGGGAIGGVVNVIDGRIPQYVPERIESALESRYNLVDDGEAVVFRLDGGLDPFALHLDGFYRDNDNVGIPELAVDPLTRDEPLGFNTKGFIANSGGRALSGTAGASFVGEQGFVGLSVNHLENDYGIPPGGAVELVAIAQKQNRYDLKGEWFDPHDLIETIRLRASYNDYEHTEMENALAGTRFENDAFEGRLELDHNAIGPLRGTIGLTGLNGRFAAVGDEAFVPRSDIARYGLFVLEEIEDGPWLFELGGRVDRSSVDPVGVPEAGHTPWSISASAILNLIEESSIQLALSRNQRAPDVVELFAFGPHLATNAFEIGSRDLRVETSYSVDLGFTVNSAFVEADLNLFYNRYDGYIFQANTGTFFDRENDRFETACSEPDACLPVFRTRQQGAIFKGYEANLLFPPADTELGGFDLTLFSDYVRGTFTDGTNVPRMPPLRYGAQLGYRFTNGCGDWNGTIRFTRADAQTDPGANETPTGGYNLLNANLSYRIEPVEETELLLFIRGTNLLNDEIRLSTSFLRNFAPEAGRSVEFGMRARF
jgi:iron complex outermembrane recepter protein